MISRSELFAGAATYYARYRHGYGTEIIDYIADTLGLDDRTRVLDLGCGPGTLAIPLAGRAGEILAVDPSEEMLAEGARWGTPGIRWLRGDSSTLGELPLGPVDHVVMGRSFHWTERERLLRHLDELLPAHGAVVLAGPTTDPADPPWEPQVQAVRRTFGLEWRANSEEYAQSGRHHDEILRGSAFNRLESRRFTRTVRQSADDIVGLQLSFSYSSPARLGERMPAFTKAVHEALDAANPSGEWREEVVTEIVVARRP
ncbi:methyltransferase domain-containing protein [Streptosporangium sp. NPDC048865]|uniref:class I SAM-dependent methyltransferase n=1 Tax=Streptosporangium sp. NPDC048865 TaxID=3155766 RepID=UPI00342734DA